MKIIILGGFLGSGKTTVLLQLAPYLAGCSNSGKNPSVVVLENEISVTDVDTKLLQSRNLTTRNLAAGCICCTSSAQLVDSVQAIARDFDPDYLIVEATGMAYPDSIQETLEKETPYPTKMAALVDASRWRKLKLAMPMFVQSQLRCADVVYVNKADLADPLRLPKLCEELADLAKGAPVCAVSAIGGLDPQVFSVLK